MPFFPTLLKPGNAAPHFRLLDHWGRNVGLDDFRDAQGLVLLFFTSDRQAADVQLLRDFMAAAPRFREAGIEVLALSAINWENLHHLGQRLNSPFPLLFDVACRYARLYGAMLIPKFVTARAVFAINRQGNILLSSKNITPEAVLAAFKQPAISP